MNIVHNYYSIGDQNRLNQFTNWKNPLLLTFRYIQSGTVETAQFHQHSHLEIFYIKSGEGVFELLPHGSVPLKANTLLVINANVRHRQYSLAEKELGFKCRYGIDEMCEDSWRWQRLNPSGF